MYTYFDNTFTLIINPIISRYLKFHHRGGEEAVKHLSQFVQLQISYVGFNNTRLTIQPISSNI